MCFFGATLERKKGERRENLTLATATRRTACFCLEPRAEIRACITCPDAFIVNWESSFFLDHAAHTAGREVEQTKEKDWVPSPKELLEERKPRKAAVGKYWKCIHAVMKLQLPTIGETEKTLQFLGQLLVTYFLLPPLSGTQRFTREHITSECRQYDHIYARIQERPLLTLPRTSTTAADQLL